MPNDFAMRVSIDGICHVRFALEGDLDMAVTPVLEASLLRAAEVYDHHHIELDMSAVTFIDSCGIAALVEVHRRLAVTNSHLAVVNPAPLVVGLLELSGVDSFLDIRPGVLRAPAPYPAHRPAGTAPGLDRAG